MNPIYCKYSNDRADRFRIKTVIREEADGERAVYKYALDSRAAEHVDGMYGHYLQFEESYAGSLFVPNRCERVPGGVKFEFVEGETLEACLDRLYLAGRYMELVEKIKEYRDALYALSDNRPFVYTKEFEEVFGGGTSFSGCSSLKISNIDLVFGNILLGDRWTVIDYEWTFDFPVPIDFVVYRALYYYVHGNTKREKLIGFHIFRLLGISDLDFGIYGQMERCFQEYVAGGRATLAKLKPLMLKRKERALSENGKLRTDFVQIYFNDGTGYREEDSLKQYYDCRDASVSVTFAVERDVESVRVDPATGPVVVRDLVIEVNGGRVLPSGMNGAELKEGLLAFSDPDPQFEITQVHKGDEVSLSFSAGVYDEAWRSYTDKVREQEEGYRAVCERKRQLEVVNGELTAYVQGLHGRFSWKVLSNSKKALKSLKNEGFRITLAKCGRKVKRKVFKKGPAAAENRAETAVRPEAVLQRRPAEGKEKILVVVHEAQKAGATLLSMNIIETIRAVSDYEPVILLLSGGAIADKIRRMGICFELNQPNYLRIHEEERFRAVVDEIAGMGVKYALCNSVVTGIVLPALKERGIRTITMVHELPTSIEAYHFTDAAHMVQAYSDDVVFAAEFVKRQYVGRFPLEEGRCHVIPQGCYSEYDSLNVREKARNRKRLCEALGLPLSVRLVVGCGYGNFRKGLDWFGNIALRMMKEDGRLHFVWLGEWEEEFKTWLDHDLAVERLDNRFHWLPYMENPGYVFGGADLFLLSSREDPFPSVALEAMKQYTPVLAFERAGGIPEILADGRGIVVEYGNCGAAAAEIGALLEDRPRYQEMILKAKDYVRNLTPRNYLLSLLDIVTKGNVRTKKLPDLRVSVVIPNYNYERYLPERLDSVLKQTVPPFEVIFLDDVSSDDSVAVAREILEESGIRHKIIANTENQGCFKQWVNGIRQAEGDIIWIAEADDLCRNTFIERLLPFFEDDQVNLAYAQSEVIYENNEHSGYVYTEYTKSLDADKWSRDYVNHGEAEIIDGLGIKNTIPNASGALMRKSAFEGIDGLLSKFAVSGDWFAYVYLIRTGKIAFCSDVLNYHRRHQNSIIHQKEQDLRLFTELMEIKRFMAEQFLIPESIRTAFLNHVREEYGRLMPEGAPVFEENGELSSLQAEVERLVGGRAETYHFLDNVPARRILFVIPDFEMGGGQTLVVRLANYFSRFHQVFLYNARPWLREERIVRMISEKVTILESRGDPEELRRHILERKVEIINDHIWWSDKIVYKAAADLKVRIILSMHGCYEALLENPGWDGEFADLAPRILGRADAVIYATDKNKKIFETVPVEAKAHLVHYGYERESIPPKKREEFGIRENSFVFGLVARGIKEKGFGEAAAAFQRLRERADVEMDLILVGNGPFIDELKEQYGEEGHIHFADSLKRPSEWIGWVKTFDCALLPTYYISESLPNSVIEYLAYGVPVISTNIGDIRYMLKDGEHEAGILLELHEGKVEVEELAGAMAVMVKDREAYLNYRAGARMLFGQFDIRNFAENYYVLFEGKFHGR
ncbi:MAG: glycosyltransferase [Lachnospiraceae bacterium]|nr:glycosyltransferase [Lachnospiraceae bacterium]